MTSHKAKREAFAIVPETCPAVNAALSNITAAVETADGLIKEQTEALRNALLDALDRAIDAEEAVERLEREVDALKDKVADLEKDLERAQELADA